MRKVLLVVLVNFLAALAFWVPDGNWSASTYTSQVTGKAHVKSSRGSQYLMIGSKVMSCREGALGIAPECPRLPELSRQASEACIASLASVRTKFGLNREVLVALKCDGYYLYGFSAESLRSFRVSTRDFDLRYFFWPAQTLLLAYSLTKLLPAQNRPA
jgi:hypothetical protein